MPTKRKRVTRAAPQVPEREAEYWATYFDHGCFLLAGRERELGLSIGPGRESWLAAERSPEVAEAARDAWARLGADYIAGRLGHVDDGRGRGAWALEQFGRPPS